MAPQNMGQSNNTRGHCYQGGTGMGLALGNPDTGIDPPNLLWACHSLGTLDPELCPEVSTLPSWRLTAASVSI